MTAKPIEFERSALGLEAERPWTYVDLGPSGTLATFLRYLLPRSAHTRIVDVLTPNGSGLSNLRRAVELLRGPLRAAA